MVTFPLDTHNVPYYDNLDANNVPAVPVDNWIRNGSGIFVPVSKSYPLPVETASEQTIAAAIPTLATLLGVSDGTNIRALKGQSSSYPNLLVSLAYNGSLAYMASPADSQGPYNSLFAESFNMVHTSGSTGVWDRLRYAATHKFAEVTTAGDTAIWTPSTGKKFRLLGGIIVCGSMGASELNEDISIYFKDGSTTISPHLLLTSNQVIPLDGLFTRSNGILSSTANNVLYVRLTASTAIKSPISVWVCGTEE